ncbi:MAG: bifunctional folylpolyglutamate synthase/dihydrofolate synthase [Aggregatilineales bacterium]
MDDAALNAYITALSAVVRPVRAADYPRPLEPFRALLHALGDPHAAFPAVVVAGSVGKGTACHQIAAVLAAAGLRPALYTGPHLHSFRERFVCDGAMISLSDFVEGANVVTAAARAAPRHAFSTFELATALALWWFNRCSPDVLVLECGLGGRFDAVGCLPNALAAFTPIELEHAAMLGGSLETIAWHKAGIIQPGGLAVTVPQLPPVMRVLRSEAARAQARLLANPQPLPLTLFNGRGAAGSGADAEVALHKALLPSLGDGAGGGAAGGGPLPPGRGERVYVGERAVVIDGGHTPGAARWLRGLITLLVGPETPVRLVVGMLADKNAAGYLRTFDQPRCRITLTRARGHRAAEPEALAAAAALQQASVEIQPELLAALRSALTGSEALLVVSGSLRLAAAAREAFGLLPPELAVEARATRALFEEPGYLSRLV